MSIYKSYLEVEFDTTCPENTPLFTVPQGKQARLVAIVDHPTIFTKKLLVFELENIPTKD